MAAVDNIIFIDSNQYLDLYRTASGKKLLAALNEQSAHIFVTAQVVEEVRRRKVVVAASFLEDQFKEMRLPNFAVPDHLFGTAGGRVGPMRETLREIHDKINKSNNELMKLSHDLLEEISRSEDEVSKELAGIFGNAVPHTEVELLRAKARMERGNPPGKRSDPLGDQLTWEQILSRCSTTRRLWIITRDGDYATEYRGKVFLNAALRNDLSKLLSPAPKVFCFNNIPDGIKHFADTTQVRAKELPAPEVTEQIKKEQESLPPLGWLNTSVSDAASTAVWNAVRQKAFAAAQMTAMINTLASPVFPPPAKDKDAEEDDRQ